MSSIRDYVFSQPLFSTHDHQRGFTHFQGSKDRIRLVNLLSYAGADLAVAGAEVGRMQEAFSTPDGMERLWPFVQTTGYGQALGFWVKKILDMEVKPANLEEIDRRLQDYCRTRTSRQLYEELYRLAGVTGDVNDVWWQTRIEDRLLSGQEHPAVVRHALRTANDEFFVMRSSANVRRLADAFGASLTSLDDLEALLRRHVENGLRQGPIVGLKLGLAYHRTLDIGPSRRAEAEQAFKRVLQDQDGDRRPLHDHLVHVYIRLAREFSLPVQIHTGYLAGIGSDIRQGDPAALMPLLLEYRDVRFDLFHAGWPYSDVLGAMGKQLPNVWLDMCWVWAMNPVASERILAEWLACVPHNKIFAFGADTEDPFNLVGYAEQARRGLVRVFESKVKSGEYSEELACHVAGRVMSQNAREFFGV